MRILVCGGRDFENAELLEDTLINKLGLKDKYNFSTIIHGNARGADTLAALFGYRMGFDVEAYPADWDAYGKAAGHIRNKQMLDEGKPDLVIAFPGGKGTANMIKQAQEAGVPVEIINV